MARINLLPWRQEERERRNKEFNMVAGAAAVLAILATLLAMTLLNTQLSNQQDANARIEGEIKNLEAVIKDIEGLEQQREEMLSRLKVIQDLQGQRSVPVRVWDDIARAIPSAMYLVNMKREDNTITLSGFADNANVVSQLVRNLDSSQWLANSAVPNIQTNVRAYADPNAANRAGDQIIAPESNYIRFTVTTQVIPDTPADNTEQNQTLAMDSAAANQPAFVAQQEAGAAQVPAQANTATPADNQAAQPNAQTAAPTNENQPQPAQANPAANQVAPASQTPVPAANQAPAPSQPVATSGGQS